MTRRILAILLATVLAALGTAAVLLYVKGADNRAVADVAAVEVLVAKQRVPAGTTGETIRNQQLVELVRLPAGSVPLDEAMTKIPAEDDKLVLTSDLQPRQVVLRGMFGQSTRSSGGLDIPEGKVAVSVAVSAADQVAGYIRPGSEVAVYASFHLASNGEKVLGGSGDLAGAAVLLARVDVIAVGAYGQGVTTTTPLGGNTATGQAQSGDQVLVTVAVSPVDAAKLMSAAQAQAIHLALLGGDGLQLRPGTGVDSGSMFR